MVKTFNTTGKWLFKAIKNLTKPNDEIKLVNYKFQYEKLFETKNSTNKFELPSLPKETAKLVVTAKQELLKAQQLMGFDADGKLIYFDEIQNYAYEANSEIIKITAASGGKKVEVIQDFPLQTATNIDFISERVKLVKEAMKQPENLIRTESHDGYETKFYQVENLGEMPVTEL
ncbi:MULTISPECIES: hypothetical protein [unclassified Rickettsia]|uniref:hypothetical protein n=1 Tax=unclassified Rickettsia TaxID=114295 RepID=UPI003132F39D